MSIKLNHALSEDFPRRVSKLYSGGFSVTVSFPQQEKRAGNAEDMKQNRQMAKWRHFHIR